LQHHVPLTDRLCNLAAPVGPALSSLVVHQLPSAEKRMLLGL
jgi:hypothetical protein